MRTLLAWQAGCSCILYVCGSARDSDGGALRSTNTGMTAAIWRHGAPICPVQWFVLGDATIVAPMPVLLMWYLSQISSHCSRPVILSGTPDCRKRPSYPLCTMALPGWSQDRHGPQLAILKPSGSGMSPFGISFSSPAISFRVHNVLCSGEVTHYRPMDAALRSAGHWCTAKCWRMLQHWYVPVWVAQMTCTVRKEGPLLGLAHV